MNRGRLRLAAHTRFLRRAAIAAALLCGSLGLASADSGTPPVLFGRVEDFASAPAAVSCTGSELYCQLTNAGPDFLSSQDFATDLDSFDSLAADDFFISPAGPVKSWEISSVRVGGRHFPDGASTATTSVTVKFYADAGTGRPMQELFSQLVSGGSLSDPGASGEYVLSLSPPVRLAVGARYWVSVQAVKPVEGAQWGWLESTAALANNFPAVWKNPGNATGTGCIDWTAVGTCAPGTGPNLLFSVSGLTSTTSLSPVLSAMSPTNGLNENVTLSLTGQNFAPGAIVSWTVPSKPVFTVTASFISASALTATIPAGQVTPLNSTAQVAVVNPSPCYGACATGTLPFFLGPLRYVYLPLVRR